MNAEEMKDRTKGFAISIARLTESIQDSTINKPYKSQIIRASSSVGANYRAARRAKSKADFINKLKIVEEELDESLFFLELLLEFNKSIENSIKEIYREGETLLKIIVSTIVSVRNNRTSYN